jgi:hypothetical protein
VATTTGAWYAPSTAQPACARRPSPEPLRRGSPGARFRLVHGTNGPREPRHRGPTYRARSAPIGAINSLTRCIFRATRSLVPASPRGAPCKHRNHLAARPDTPRDQAITDACGPASKRLCVHVEATLTLRPDDQRQLLLQRNAEIVDVDQPDARCGSALQGMRASIRWATGIPVRQERCR